MLQSGHLGANLGCGMIELWGSLVDDLVAEGGKFSIESVAAFALDELEN